MSLKTERLLSMFYRMINGQTINKYDEAARFEVDPKTIKRDMEDISESIENIPEISLKLKHIDRERTYEFEKVRGEYLTDSQIFAVCKILLASRSLPKSEMEPIVKALVSSCALSEDTAKIRSMIKNELYHYTPPHHNSELTEKLWALSRAVGRYDKAGRITLIHYASLKNKNGSELYVQPVGLLFSEYYFYLLAYVCKSDETPEQVKYDYPTVFRVDRIIDFDITDIKFQTRLTNRFEEGEFRRRVQFMFTGELVKVTFECANRSLEAVLDRLPTATVKSRGEDTSIVYAECFGDGIMMWLRAQGDNVKIIEHTRGVTKIL